MSALHLLAYLPSIIPSLGTYYSDQSRAPSGGQPPLQDIPDQVLETGWLTGGTSAASDIAEVFLMQMGSGYTKRQPPSSTATKTKTNANANATTPLAWGELGPQQVSSN